MLVMPLFPDIPKFTKFQQNTPTVNLVFNQRMVDLQLIEIATEGGDGEEYKLLIETIQDGDDLKQLPKDHF